MSIGIAAHTMSTPHMTVEAAIELYRRLGFDAFDLVYQTGYGCGLCEETPEREIERLARVIRDAGLRVSCLIPYVEEYNSLDERVRGDALDAAKSRRADVLLVDTAGRLHNKVNLMEELKKIRRSLAKQDPTAPHETLLVLDGTSGQNALSQATAFNQATELTGLVLTKLDGTAKGGIVVALRRQMDLPVKLIGVGEGIDDLQPFDGAAFARALFAE